MSEDGQKEDEEEEGEKKKLIALPQSIVGATIFYDEEGTPVLLALKGKQYTVSIGGGPAPTAPPPQKQQQLQQPLQPRRERESQSQPLPLPPRRPVPVVVATKWWNRRSFVVALNLSIVLLAVSVYSTAPSSIYAQTSTGLKEWVCRGGGDDEIVELLPLESAPPPLKGCLCGSGDRGGGGGGAGEIVLFERTWPLHTFSSFFDVYKGVAPLSKSVTPLEIEHGSFRRVIDALAANLLILTEKASSLACMHHLNHTLGYNARVCALRRPGRQIVPLYNLELKGYSNTSRVDPETSILCKEGTVSAKSRRLVVDVEYLTISGTYMRSLIEDPEEAVALQRAWEEMRGTYHCPK